MNSSGSTRMPPSLPLQIPTEAGAAPLPASEAQLSSAKLFEAHARFVLRALVHLGVPQADAHDACQEVFLAAFRRHDQLRAGSRETTWLYGFCLRVAANHRRKRARKREDALDQLQLVAAGVDHERDLDASRLARRLAAALERLPEKKREVFVLFELAERDMEEVAEIVAAPLKTCYSRLYAARSELQAALGVTSSQEVER